MKISKLELINFKRFTHLVIDKIQDDAKLVLLIGSNGSGKSSVFDGFEYLSKGQTATFQYFFGGVVGYYEKDIKFPISIDINFQNGEKISSADWNNKKNATIAKKFIGRSSIRIIPRLSTPEKLIDIREDADSPLAFIDNDERFINDATDYIQQINNAVRVPVFQDKQVDTRKVFRDFIEPLNASLQYIFGGDSKTGIRIIDIVDATYNEPPKLIFQKGSSKINYDLLSHGEKQVVILLLNFIVRKQYYEDAIIFIDEIDCHLNTTLQERLLEEIVTKWIPDSSQLWTASHALGFIAYANKSKEAAIIDFDLFDFDVKQELWPSEKNNLDVFEIVIPRVSLFKLMEGKKIVVCENKNDEYYNLLSIPNTVFGGVKDSRDVFLYVKNDPSYYSLRDRDFISDAEIEKIEAKYPHHSILRYYNFENYLYHPDNIQELDPAGFDKEQYIAEIKKQKETKYDKILLVIISSRQNYEEFKTDDKLKDKEVDSIVDDLKSDELERFYKFFDMKHQFNKTVISAFNLSKEKLVQTAWFKRKISEILGRN